MTSDDWKGETLIRHVHSDRFTRAAEGSRVMNAVAKRKREKKGAPCFAAEQHQRWFRWALARTERGPE